MNKFIQKFGQKITGILSGFDRLVFRGTIRQLAYVEGMRSYLSQSNILLKDFSTHVSKTTDLVKKSATNLAERNKRPLIYLDSAKISKENTAKEIMRDDGVKQGLICIFTAVEPCISYDIFRNRAAKKLELQSRRRKCLHIYQYWFDPQFGFMHARIQTWFPFNVQICINGREWLARQLDKDGIAYVRSDNCFPHIDKVYLAQRRMDKQLTVSWPDELSRFIRYLNPYHQQMFSSLDLQYYWSVFQSEWATDIMFRQASALDDVYMTLIHHGMTTFQSPDVMRFLGKRLPASGHVHGKFAGEVTSDIKRRVEGVRIKHCMQRNSIKAYNKAGSILRIETTINDPSVFKVSRPKQGGDGRKRHYLTMRRGIADLKRRADVSQAANRRYIEALAAVDPQKPMRDLVSGLLKPTHLNGSRVRALNPWSSDDLSLLTAIIRGEYTINGFRNRDIRKQLFPDFSASPVESRRKSAKVSRLLRILRAHGLIKKVPCTHRYQVTTAGRAIIPSIIAAYNASADQLTKLAA